MIRIDLRAALALAILPAPLSAEPSPPAEEAAQTRGFYLQLIHQARTDGRPRAALAYLDDFDRQHPGDVDARLLRVNSLLDLGQVDAADAALAKLSDNARGAAIAAARGNIEAARGRWTAATTYYRTAAIERPTDPLLRNALGYALLRAGLIEGAIEQLRGAMDLAPGDAVIRNNLLLALAVGGHDADVAATIRQSGDLRAQAELKRQVMAEAARIAALPPPLAPPAHARPAHVENGG